MLNTNFGLGFPSARYRSQGPLKLGPAGESHLLGACIHGAQPEEATWVRLSMVLPPVGGAKGVRCSVCWVGTLVAWSLVAEAGLRDMEHQLFLMAIPKGWVTPPSSHPRGSKIWDLWFGFSYFRDWNRRGAFKAPQWQGSLGGETLDVVGLFWLTTPSHVGYIWYSVSGLADIRPFKSLLADVFWIIVLLHNRSLLGLEITKLITTHCNSVFSGTKQNSSFHQSQQVARVLQKKSCSRPPHYDHIVGLGLGLGLGSFSKILWYTPSKKFNFCLSEHSPNRLWNHSDLCFFFNKRWDFIFGQQGFSHWNFTMDASFTHSLVES